MERKEIVESLVAVFIYLPVMMIVLIFMAALFK